LNSHLVNKGLRVMSLREAETNLEQVFLTVTGDAAQPDVAEAGE